MKKHYRQYAAGRGDISFAWRAVFSVAKALSMKALMPAMLDDLRQIYVLASMRAWRLNHFSRHYQG